MRKLAYILHGFLFAAGSAVYIYVNTSDAIVFIPPPDVLNPTIFSVVVFIFFIVVGFFLTRSLESAGLMASIFLLGFFYHWSTFAAILIIGLLSLLLIRILFKKLDLISTHLVLNAMSIAVFSYCFFQFFNLIKGVPSVSSFTTIQPIHVFENSLSSQTATPDIYYIILDSYGRADMLKEVLDYDNSSFINALEKRGFIVASRSQSNYTKTLLSLSSSLNMQYLDSLSSIMVDANVWWPVTSVIQQNEVRNIMQNWGYKTVFFASGWDYTDIRDGDFYKAPYPIMLKNFENAVLNGTNWKILRDINKIGIAYPSYETHRQIILYSFKMLPEISSIPGPKFVFAHINSPHPPYVFDRTGNPVDPNGNYSLLDTYRVNGSHLESQNRFIDQMMYINQETITTIDGILSNSIIPPIIIIQGDHGSETVFEHNSTDNICLFERFSILNALYLPGVDPDVVPMDLSPVNTFRYIFNQYFQTELEILPNRQYFSPFKNIFLFTDVTGQSQEPCKIDSDR